MAREGRTKTPCLGCKRRGRQYHEQDNPKIHYGDDRPKDGLCDDCRTALEQAKKLVARTERANKSQAEHKTYRVNHDMPYMPHVDYDVRHAMSDKLKALVSALGVEAVTDSERDYHTPRIFTRPTSGSSSYSYDDFIVIHPENATLIDAIEHAIVACVSNAHDKGFDEGRNLLFALANGELTTSELDDQLARKR